jgi:CubicO group peptidase (beta-lactamase class C family)
MKLARRAHIWFGALVIATAAVAMPAGQTPAGAPYAELRSAGPYVESIHKSEAVIRTYMAAHGVPGLSIAVAVDGQIVWSEGFGLANVEQGTIVTPLTRFRSGSVAKTVTGVATALLYEQGKIDLDAPIQKYLPAFPEKGAPITARMLAGHLAGFRHYPADGNEFFNAKHYTNVVDALEIFDKDPLLFKPGTKYSYSSYGVNLLGAVIQEAAHVDFLTLLQTLVFDPVGMRSTTGDFVDRITPFRTSFYERTGGKPSYHTRKTSWGSGEPSMLLNAPYTDNSNKYPSGGLMTTPEDLVRFGSALLKPGLLKAETLKLLFTSQRTSTGQETGYAICWEVKPDPEGHRMYAHGGGSVGGTSYLLIYPDDRVVLAVQNNLTDANYQDIPRQIARMFATGRT